MLTVFDICSKMEKSGRPITARTLRNWWTIGLMPAPAQKGLGHGFGSKTIWGQEQALKQAKTVYDLFHRTRRRVLVEDVTVQLWVLGFRIPTNLVGNALIRRLNRLSRKVGSHDDERDEFISQIGVNTARYAGRGNGAPTQVRHAITDLISEMLRVFFKADDADAFYELRELWPVAGPYLTNSNEENRNRAAMKVEEVLAILPFFKEYASLPAQLDTVSTATSYEFVTAQRIFQLLRALGHVLIKRFPIRRDCDSSSMEVFDDDSALRDFGF